MPEIPPVASSGDVRRQVQPVHPDGQREHEHSRDDTADGDAHPPGAEELAVALAGDGRAELAAQLDQDENGVPVIRIVDRERGETVAVLTPEELRDLAEQTGLPPGMLLRARS
jgi:hypothetical protein